MKPKRWKLFLDDERFPPVYTWKYRIRAFLGLEHKWIICRDYESACKAVSEMGLPFFISFDHDLGLGKNGFHFASWLVNYCLDNCLKPTFTYYVHSQNPIGRNNIEGLLESFKRIQT